MRILVVDDDQTIRLLYSAVLKSQGHVVETEDSALGALTAAMAFKPDVVVLDVNMPGMNGDRVMRLLTDEAGFAEVAFVLHSAMPQAELDALARSCGAAGGIPKVGTPAQFAWRLQAFMAAR